MKRLSFIAVLLVCCIQVLLAQPTIFLVRHAEKAQGGDASDPEISQAGQARAAALATTLKDAGITAIYATEFKRTQETAAPVGEALHIPVTVIPAKETALLVSKLKEASGNVLVVGHSNTLPEIVAALGGSLGFQITDRDYTNLLVWTGGASPQLLRLHCP